MRKLCRAFIYNALVVCAGVLIVVGNCNDPETPDPPIRPANADYTRIVHPIGPYQVVNFDYPKYEYRGTPAMPQHINLIFVEIPGHTELVHMWFSQFIDGNFVNNNEVCSIKSDSRFSGNWNYVDVYGNPRSISVNTFTINANVPSDTSGSKWLIQLDSAHHYFFRTIEDAVEYYVGDEKKKGAVLTDIQIDEPLNSRFFNSWTNFIFLSPAYVRNENALGIATFSNVGRHNNFNEYVSAGYSIIFLGRIRETIERGYRTYINGVPPEVFAQYGRGSFDEHIPRSSALARMAGMITHHEAIHVFQQKLYEKVGSNNINAVSHCDTENCLMRPSSRLAWRIEYGTTTFYITNYSSSDFASITLKSGSACWVHRLSGNVLSWVTRDGLISLQPNERRR